MPSSGADTLVIALLNEVTVAITSGLTIVSSFVGLYFMAVASYHAYEHAQFRSDTTIVQIGREFAVACLALSITSLFASTGGMPFGSGSSGYAVVQFQATGTTNEGVAMANLLLGACLAFLAVVGRVCQFQALVACYSLGKGRGETTFLRAFMQFMLGGLLADGSRLLAAMNTSLGSGLFS